MSESKIIIVAPAWRQPGYVGNYRIERFIRWLSKRGDEVVVVRAGEIDAVETMPWGIEIILRDPLGLYRDNATTGTTPARKPNALRRHLAYWILNPEPTIVWCNRAVRNSLLLKHACGTRWVISTSPPESAHVAAAKLAHKIGAKLVIDMRDGWLDEPLRPLLQTSSLRRWREGRLEYRILRQAWHIFVTSSNWQEMLQARLPFAAEKTTVLTNAYPRSLVTTRRGPRQKSHLTILHAGQMTNSSLSRRPRLLLDLLLSGLAKFDGTSGTLVFLGNLREDDLRELKESESQFAQLGWKIGTAQAVPREQMFEQLIEADGLLLLSASDAAIPSKCFEYIPTGKPVLAACPANSSVWRMAADLPQFFTADFRTPSQAASSVSAFLHACRSGDAPYATPACYSDSSLSEVFLQTMSE